MTQPTVTDEDRALVIALCGVGGTAEDEMRAGQADHLWAVQAAMQLRLLGHRQGIEIAIELAERSPYSEALVERLRNLAPEAVQGIEVKGWQDIATAPRDGTAIQARIWANGDDNIIAWQVDALIDSDGNSCGAWSFVTDQEPPACWTDGWCWEVNEDGEPSAKPTHWKPAPEAGE